MLTMKGQLARWDDGQRQLEEYEMHCQEIQCNATALLANADAPVLVGSIAQDLADLVQQHATANGEHASVDPATALPSRKPLSFRRASDLRDWTGFLRRSNE